MEHFLSFLSVSLKMHADVIASRQINQTLIKYLGIL